MRSATSADFSTSGVSGREVIAGRVGQLRILGATGT
jgi:hypothetical protein